MGYRHHLYAVPKKQIAEIQACKTNQVRIVNMLNFTLVKNDYIGRYIICEYDVPTADENFYCAYAERRETAEA